MFLTNICSYFFAFLAVSINLLEETNVCEVEWKAFKSGIAASVALNQ